MPAWFLPLLLPALGFCHPCSTCHPREVTDYSKTGMGQSLRSPGKEPDGSFEHSASASRFLIRSNQRGLFQRMSHDGQNSDYRIDYVIGSGTHASCYLARLGDHLFESPICSYPARGYAMAPGFEDNPAPGYTRPITVECLLCHSNQPLPIRGSLNRYESPAFAGEAISCERCHGDPAAHLTRPVPGSIVNPVRLSAAKRDSVCEQCHLSGAVRVANPGKTPADFRPGQLLEDFYTTYVRAAPEGNSGALRVVSQSEQLALSRCALASNGRLWCATCHNPHRTPANPVAYFRTQCLTCHTRPFSRSHPAATSNCLPCHMPRRETQDGAHTAFTDHRIARRLSPPGDSAAVLRIRPWREPAPDLRKRNVAVALSYAGLRYSSETLLAESYPLLLEVQKQFPSDPEVLVALGQSLLQRKEPAAAARYFEQAIGLDHRGDPSYEDSAGAAWLEAGDMAAAARHFERALELDSLLLPDIEALRRIYQETGDQAKQAALMTRVQDAMRTGPQRQAQR